MGTFVGKAANQVRDQLHEQFVAMRLTVRALVPELNCAVMKTYLHCCRYERASERGMQLYHTSRLFESVGYETRAPIINVESTQAIGRC